MSIYLALIYGALIFGYGCKLTASYVFAADVQPTDTRFIFSLSLLVVGGLVLGGCLDKLLP